MEKIHIPKTVRSQEREETPANKLLTPQQVKKHPAQMHLPTATFEPPADMPPGIHPARYQSVVRAMRGDKGNSPTHTAAAKPQADQHRDDHGLASLPTLEDVSPVQVRVPSTILLQLQQNFSEGQEERQFSSLESRRSKHGYRHTPKRQPTVSSTSVYPFSEDVSPCHELETRALHLKSRESYTSHEKISRNKYHQESLSVEQEHEYANLQPSVSPDYMLVGAHFTDNNLVLVDKEGKVIHQLTDTEAESDANIIANLSELTVYTQTSIEQSTVHTRTSIEQPNVHAQASIEKRTIQQVENSNSEDLTPSITDVSKHSVGTNSHPTTGVLEPCIRQEEENDKMTLFLPEDTRDGMNEAFSKENPANVDPNLNECKEVEASGQGGTVQVCDAQQQEQVASPHDLHEGDKTIIVSDDGVEQEVLTTSIDINGSGNGVEEDVVTTSTGVHRHTDKANNIGNVQREELLTTSTDHEGGNTQNGENKSEHEITSSPMVKEHEQVVRSDVESRQATIWCTELHQISIVEHEKDKTTSRKDGKSGKAPEVVTSTTDHETNKTECGQATRTLELATPSAGNHDNDKEPDTSTDISDVQITSNRDVELLFTNLHERDEIVDDGNGTATDLLVEQHLPTTSEHKLGAQENGGEKTLQLGKH